MFLVVVVDYFFNCDNRESSDWILAPSSFVDFY